MGHSHTGKTGMCTNSSQALPDRVFPRLHSLALARNGWWWVAGTQWRSTFDATLVGGYIYYIGFCCNYTWHISLETFAAAAHYCLRKRPTTRTRTHFFKPPKKRVRGFVLSVTHFSLSSILIWNSTFFCIDIVRSWLEEDQEKLKQHHLLKDSIDNTSS